MFITVDWYDCGPNPNEYVLAFNYQIPSKWFQSTLSHSAPRRSHNMHTPQCDVDNNVSPGDHLFVSDAVLRFTGDRMSIWNIFWNKKSTSACDPKKTMSIKPKGSVHRYELSFRDDLGTIPGSKICIDSAVINSFRQGSVCWQEPFSEHQKTTINEY